MQELSQAAATMVATTQTRPEFIDTYWIIPEYTTKPYGKVSLTRQDRRTFTLYSKTADLSGLVVNLCTLIWEEINMRIIDTSGAQQEKIKLEISHESHSRLIRAREVAGNIYRYFEPNECYSKPNPWLPEILDYLCADMDCILHEIDKYS